jgi:hypothetical protein
MVVYIRFFIASWRVHAEINDKLKKERIFLLKRKKKKVFFIINNHLVSKRKNLFVIGILSLVADKSNRIGNCCVWLIDGEDG